MEAAHFGARLVELVFVGEQSALAARSRPSIWSRVSGST